MKIDRLPLTNRCFNNRQIDFIRYSRITGVNGKPPSPVKGGGEAREGEFPYQVSLQISGRVLCGGSIIHRRYILTAAHCTHELPAEILTDMVVVTGTNNCTPGNGVAYEIETVTEHPLYAPSKFINDIAILKVSIDSPPVKFP